MTVTIEYRWTCEACDDSVVLGTTYRPQTATVRCNECGAPMEFKGPTSE